MNLDFDIDFFTKKWKKSSQKRSGICSNLHDMRKFHKYEVSCDDEKHDSTFKMTLPPTVRFDMDFFH